jgi:hypothetical protein
MPMDLETNISPIFSTPLLVFTPASHKQINAELSQKILQREASVPTYSDYEVVGWSSPHDLTMLDWAGEPLRELFAPVIEVAKQVTAFSERSGHSACRPDWQVVEVWTNVQRNGGSNAAHSHPGSFWQESITWTWATCLRPATAEESYNCMTRGVACRACRRPISVTACRNSMTPAETSLSLPRRANASSSPDGCFMRSRSIAEPGPGSVWRSTLTLSFPHRSRHRVAPNQNMGTR